MPAEGTPQGELERLRLENETLSAVVGVVTSGPDLTHILDRVVDLLTRATDAHACFVYIRAGELLSLRAASPVYSHLVGRISFGAHQGLAGWTMRRREPAFIREGATADPRTHYVPELEEERFQSMVAVPIPARAGESIGAIVLHTAAPREFDEGIINVLSRAASLVAGAIENAHLYEDAHQRVDALTRLAGLGREIAAVTDRGSLSELAVTGVRDLLGADACRLYEVDEVDGGLHPLAAAPATEGDDEEEGALVQELIEARGEAGTALLAGLARVLGLTAPPASADAVSLVVGGRRTGALLVASAQPRSATAPELLRAAAQQIALASQRIELIERLTEENLARDLFDALVGGELTVAAKKATAAGLDLSRPHVVLEARPRGGDAAAWSARATAVERTIKNVLPPAFCDVTPTSVRALAPVGAEGVDSVRGLVERLAGPAAEQGLAIGVSEGRRGREGIARALREAADAAEIAGVLGGEHVLLYRDSGAYRYLIDVLDTGGPEDHLRTAVETIAAYDRERGSQLLATLDEYLSQGRSVAATARALFIHVNTLRQRLERIEQLTGLRVGEEELLALQLAVKLGRIRAGAGE